MREDFFPVCSPELLSRGPPLREPADLAHHVLLHDEFGYEQCLPDQLDWARWLAANGITNVDAQRGLRFSFSHMTLQAAAEGQGVGLASSALLADDLSTGRLVKPFGDLAVRGPYGSSSSAPRNRGPREGRHVPRMGYRRSGEGQLTPSPERTP